MASYMYGEGSQNIRKNIFQMALNEEVIKTRLCFIPQWTTNYEE